MLLCLLSAACSSPPKTGPKQSQPDTATVMSETLALTSTPGRSPVEQKRARDLLLSRSDAMATLIREFNRLPSDNIGRWHLIWLITAGAERGAQSAIKFLLRESLVPDPPPNGHSHGMASSDAPEEVMVKLEAATGLILALIANASGAADAVNELLRQSDAWIAKTVAIQMAHDRVMDQTYSSIMADRGFVSRFRDATDEEVRARSTVTPQNLPNNDPPPPAL
jgi:hypothetical protein